MGSHCIAFMMWYLVIKFDLNVVWSVVARGAALGESRCRNLPHHCRRRVRRHTARIWIKSVDLWISSFSPHLLYNSAHFEWISISLPSLFSIRYSPSALDCHYPTSCRHDRVTCKTTSRARATLHAVAAAEAAMTTSTMILESGKIFFLFLFFLPFFLDVVVFSHLPCSFRWVAIKTLLLCYMHMRRRDDDGNEANGTVKLTWN